MSAVWPTKPLRAVCDFRGGGTPSKAVARYWEGNIPWVSPKDVKGEIISDSIDHISPDAIEGSATSLVPEGSILIVVRSGILARIVPLALAGRELTINQDLKAICPSAGLDGRYVYYFLNSKMDDLLALVTRGATVHRISTDDIRSLPIPIPPLSEQKRIVAILDEAFEGIATAKANAEKSLQGSRDLFDGYLESVFSTGIGDWPTRSLGEICGFEGGSQPPKSEFIHSPRDGYVRFIQIRDFGSDKNITYIPVSKKNRLCEREDILIGRYGASVGKILTGLAGAYNVALIKTSPDPRLLDRDYFYQYLKSRAFQVPLMRVAARSAQDGFSKEDISGFAVPLPSLSVQRAVVGRIGPLSTDVRRVAMLYEQKLAALDDLKKSLLHHAFSGRL